MWSLRGSSAAKSAAVRVAFLGLLRGACLPIPRAFQGTVSQEDLQRTEGLAPPVPPPNFFRLYRRYLRANLGALGARAGKFRRGVPATEPWPNFLLSPFSFLLFSPL